MYTGFPLDQVGYGSGRKKCNQRALSITGNQKALSSMGQLVAMVTLEHLNICSLPRSKSLGWSTQRSRPPEPLALTSSRAVRAKISKHSPNMVVQYTTSRSSMLVGVGGCLKDCQYFRLITRYNYYSLRPPQTLFP